MAEQDPSIVDQLLADPSGYGTLNQTQSSPTNKWLEERDKLYNGSIVPVNPTINSDVIGNIPSGPPDPINARTESTENYAKGILGLVDTSNQWANNPNSYAQPFAYGAGWRAGNFERYYSSPSFKKLGYFPGRDNEAVYNENTGFMGEFARMVPQMAGLTVDAFADMATEWGSWGIDNPDTSMAEDFSRRMAVGMSSKGGVGGFVTNLGLNLAYPIGIMTEMFAEDLVLSAITGLSGGTAAEVTIPTMAARTAQGVKKIFSSLKDIGKIKEGFKSTYDAVRAINTVEDAKKFMSAAKLGKVADFVNPFEATTGFIRNYDKLEGLGDWAKASRGAYALYRDARFINAVTGEAKLEAGFRKIEHTNELINDYYDKNGALPSGEALNTINQNASDAAFAVSLTNIPMIFLTDKIIFDTALKGSKFLRAPEEVGAEELAGYSKKIFIENGEAKVVNTLSGENFKNVFSPKGLAARSMRYVGKNLAQGFQETAQDIIQTTFQEYYSHVYKDPTTASMAASLGTGLSSQMNGQGFETFLSGFFMGGALGVIQGGLFNGIMPMSKKLFAPKAYESWTKSKEAYINNFVNTYTDLVKNPNKYNSGLRGLDSALVRSKDMARFSDVLGLEEDSVKEVIDAQDEQAFHALIDFIEAGHGEHLKGLVSNFKSLDNESLAKAFGVELEGDDAGTDARKRLDVFEKRINLASRLWKDSFRDIPNPVDLKKAQQEGDINKINQWSNFERYRKLAVFHFYALSRAIDRQESIYNKITTDRGMEFIPSSSITPLLSVTGLNQHIQTLQAEVKALETVDPKEQKNKKEELDLYIEYREKLKEHLEEYTANAKLNLISAEMAHQADLVNLQLETKRAAKKSKKALAKVHNKIVRRVAKANNTPILDININHSFGLIHDHIILSNDITDIANIADMMVNPETVRELTNRWIPEVASQIEANKFEYYREGLEKFFSKQAIDALTQELSKLGVVIPEDQLIKLQLPTLGPITQLIDLATNKRIGVTEGKGLEAKKIIDNFMEQFTAPKEEEVPGAEAKKAEEKTQAEPGVGPDVTPDVQPVADSERIKTDVPLAKYPSQLQDLKNQLQAAFTQELERRKADGEPEISEMTFLDGPIALDIMDEYYEGKAKQTPPVTRPAPAPVATPASATTPTTTTDAKADIERKLREEVNALEKEFANIKFKDGTTLFGKDGSLYKDALDAAVYGIKETFKSTLPEYQEKADRYIFITKYFDQAVKKELAALEAESTTQTIEKVVLPIDSKYAGKIIYVSPGAGKTTLFEKYSNIIDTDQLLLEKMKQNGMTQEPGESIGQTIYRYFQTNPDRMNRIYAEVLVDMQNLADLGLTVLTGSNRFIANADHVIITEDDARLETNLKGGMSVDEFRAKETERLEEPGKPGRSVDYLTTEETLEDKLLRKDPIERGVFNPIDEINNTSNLSELKDKWQNIVQHYTNTNTLIPKEVSDVYELKLKELTKDITADAVQVGTKLKIKNNFRSTRKPDIILLWGGNIVEVTSKNSKGVYVVKSTLIPSEAAKKPIYLTNKQFNELGASLYDESAPEETIPTPEKENENVAKQNTLTEEDQKKITADRIAERRKKRNKPGEEPPNAKKC